MNLKEARKIINLNDKLEENRRKEKEIKKYKKIVKKTYKLNSSIDGNYAKILNVDKLGGVTSLKLITENNRVGIIIEKETIFNVFTSSPLEYSDEISTKEFRKEFDSILKSMGLKTK